MAERYSTVPNTSAFQERANAELTILNGRLHERLKRDLTREVYHENVLKHKEDAVIAQIKKVQQASLRDQEPGSPESDVFLTPKASPSEVPQSYSQNVSCDFPKSDVTTIANSNGSYRKGNALYYSLVHVEDELNGNNEEKCSVLEKELAEQDELFKSFQSIIIKEGKIKAKKPASLNFASTKRVKSKIVTSDDKPPSVLKFPNTRLCKIAASQDNQKETKQSCYFQTEIKPARTSYVKSPRPVKKVTKTHSQSNVENAAWRVLDEMTTKKCIVDKRDNEEVMSNPEVDCAGLDSCLEAGSSGYITGGGSPKDATGSEGFGIDTTEAASSEDIPHDNERFPASSSASSDAGTWDSTFHGNDEQTFVESHNNGTKCKTSCFNERTTNSDSVIFFTSEKKSEGKSGSVVLNVCNLINEEPSQNLAKANINKCIESLSGELGDKNISEPPPDLKTPHSSRIETADVLVTSNFVKEEVCINDCTSVSIDDDKIEVICGGLQNVSNSIGENVISSPRTNCFIDAASLSDENEVNILPSCNSFNGTKLVDVKDEFNDSGMKSELYDCGMKSELEEVNMDKQETVEKMEGKPNLIRRNTFELEADDDKLALLRQEYEKRQGSTLFQSSSSSDISLGNSNEVSNVSRVISNVSPKIDHPDTLIIDGSLGTYVPVLTDNDIQSPDSLNNDTHVKEYLEQDSANQQKVNVQQTESIIVSNDSNMNPESFLNDIGTDTNLETCSLTSLETEKIMFKSNHQLPLDNFNKFESLPIVSGSSIVSDVSSEYNHSVTSSPLVSRRKNEYAPIVSGGFDIVDTVHDTQVKSAQPKSLSPLTRSWIVDMSDSGRSSSSIRPHSRNSVDRNRSSSSGLGFFVPLDDPLSSLENVSSASNDKKESTVKQDIELNSSCGFFVDLKSDNPSQEVSKSGDPPQGEKKLFSMFIDIGDSCNTDSTSPRSKTSSPFLTGKKFRPKNHADRFTLKNEKNISTSSDSSMEINEHPEVSKGKLLFSDESLPNSSQAVSDSSLQDVSLKKQSFFMFIEANSSPVPKKRNLPSGLRPSSQRHSWNVDYKKTDSQNLPPITRREHKRANSLSVDKSNIPETNREEKFQSGPASIEESGIRHQENNHKLMMSSWHGSIKPSTELSRIINGTRHESKGSKNINGESADKVEELSCSIKSDEVYDTSNATNVSSKDDHNRTFVLDDVSKVVNANTNDLEVSTPSHDVVSDLSKDETETDPIKGSSTFSNLTDKSEDSGGAGGPNEATPKASASQQTLANGESLQFVKLSDMDKEPLKAWSSAGATVEKRTSRMSRSIPEGSWLEERMNAQSSTSRSLSRLFPHLYPRRTPEPEEPDIHSSAHSSLQSSFDPSGLECSTEGTEGSSVSGGPCSRLGEDLLRMFLEEISPDVTVEVGGRRIKAHKCILSSRCQYFAGILSGGWVESAGNVISLQGFSYNTVHFALCHIYSGAINVPDSINIVELATLADMLCLEGLKEVITYTLKVKHCHFFHKPCPTCTVGVLECLPLAAAYGLDEIYRKSLRWITRHFVRVWPAKEFANLPKELQDKCYKQHIIHMCPENVLDTIMCCNKLEATIPNVRWAQSVFSLNSKLHDAAVKYLMQHFSAVVSSDMFLSVGKEDAWTVGRIEGTLVSSAHTLSAEQACLSYSKLKNLLVTISTSTTSDWKPEFVDLLCRLDTTVEDCLVRQVGRAARTSAWTLLDLQLRRKIQDMACVAYLPGDERRRPRHSSIGKHGELPKPQSNDVSNLKSKGSDSVRKEAPTPQTKPLTPTLISQAPRPKKLSQIKSRYLEPKPVRKELSNVDSNKMTNTFGQRRVAPGKQLISSSDSSRTSSPATTRALVTRSRQRTKESDRMTMSTDSLCEMKPVKSMSTKSVPENRTHHTPIPLRKSLPSSKVEPYKVKSAESIQDKHSGTVSLAKCKTFTSCTARKLEGAPSTEPYKVKSSESISERQLSKSKPVAYCASRRSEGSPSAMKPLRSAVSSPSARRNQVSSQNPSAKQPGESLNRNSTFRVSQKSSSPSKMSPMSSRELFGKTRGGNVNQKIIGKPILNNNNSPILNGKSTTGVSAKSKTLSVGSRSGTFLKEEPTVLKKHDKVIE